MALENPVTENPAVVERGIYSARTYMFVCQCVFQWTGRVFGGLVLKNRNLQLSRKDVADTTHYVLVLNHQTWVDAWVAAGQIPVSLWHKLGLPRSFVANRILDYPILGFYLRSIGGFPAKEHPKDPYGLDYAAYLLERGHSVMIFPEGGISLHREREARRGVAVLARQPNVKLVPIHLEWKRPRWRLNLEIAIGAPFDGSKMTAQEIMDRVYELPVR